MKKLSILIAILLVLIFSFVFVACYHNNNNSSNNDDESGVENYTPGTDDEPYCKNNNGEEEDDDYIQECTYEDYCVDCDCEDEDTPFDINYITYQIRQLMALFPSDINYLNMQNRPVYAAIVDNINGYFQTLWRRGIASEDYFSENELNDWWRMTQWIQWIPYWEVEFIADNGRIECRRDDAWSSDYAFIVAHAVGEDGFYFDRWELVDRDGGIVDWTEWTLRVNVFNLMLWQIGRNDIAKIRAIFTDDEARLVDLKTPYVHIHGINGATAIFNTLPSRVAIGSYLVQYIIPDENSVLYRVGQFFQNPDPNNWFGGHFLSSHMTTNNVHLGIYFMVNHNGYPMQSLFHNDPFPFTRFEATVRLKEEVSIIRINLRNQNNDKWVAPDFVTHIVPLGETVVIGHVAHADVGYYQDKFYDYLFINCGAGFGDYFPFIRWEDGDRDLITEMHYFIIVAKYHSMTFYRIQHH